MSSPAPATSTAYKANLYPAVIQQGATAPVGAICLSGGGSRALTCALGQLSALNSITDPDGSGKTLLQKFSFISSVSGGSWAAVLYSFLPSQFSDADFLISPVPPASLTSGAVGTMPATCLGSVPQQFGLENLADFIYMLYKWGFFDLSNSELRSWFWIAGIGELVLKPFLLYDATYSSSAPYLLPAGPFSTSPAYVNGSLVAQNPGLASASFYTLAPDRPTLIVNTNVLNGDYLADPPQMPVQATAISTGAPGCAPGGMLQGGGAVESFAFTANLSGSAGAGEASVNVNRWYSLCDMAGCSSAFFAEYLLQYINAEIDKLIAAIAAKYGLSKFEQLAFPLSRVFRCGGAGSSSGL